MPNAVYLQLDEPAIAQAAQTERLRVFNERAIVGAISAFPGIALLAWVLWTGAGAEHALRWAVLTALAMAAVIPLGLKCRAALAASAPISRWQYAHFAMAAVVGVCWGMAVWFVWQPGNPVHYLVTMAILAGVAGLSMLTMASYTQAAVCFFSGIYLTPVLHVLLHPNPVTEFALMALPVGLLVQLATAHMLGRVLCRDAEQTVRNAALVARLHDLVLHDPLTGAASRRHVVETMVKLVAEYQRHGTVASAILLDLDHFKRINDQHGHPVGDRALCAAVQAVAPQLRGDDLLGRVGGEEFLVLLPNTGRAAALQLAERLRQALADTTVPTATGSLHLSASFGVAELHYGEDDGAWYHRIDSALYAAKHQGRNCVVGAG